MPAPSDKPQPPLAHDSQTISHDEQTTPAARPKTSRLKRWFSWLHDLPRWVPLVTLIISILGGGGVIAGKAVAPSNASKPASASKSTTSAGITPPPTTSTSTTTELPPSRPTHEVSFLDRTSIEVGESEAGEYGTGLGVVAGRAFPDSIRQIYESCCSKGRSEKFFVPEGFTHFETWVGLETGGIYKAEHSPSVTFEVDVGNASHRASDNIMVYNEPAEKVEVDVAGQHQIVLETRIDNPSVCEFEVCHADAVWGNARFTK
jgi:NPCBM/NEW2 domain